MEKSHIEILANVRDILLDLVDPKDNECFDMVSCTVSSPECVECLAKRIKEQYLKITNNG